MRAAKVPPKELRRVVIAASVGNIIEWYDFYIFGSLASILAVKFFEKGHPVAAFLSTVAAIAAPATFGPFVGLGVGLSWLAYLITASAAAFRPIAGAAELRGAG